VESVTPRRRFGEQLAARERVDDGAARIEHGKNTRLRVGAQDLDHARREVHRELLQFPRERAAGITGLLSSE
jgi:hypothetical protein